MTEQAPDEDVEISSPAAIPPSWMMPAEASAGAVENDVHIGGDASDAGIGRLLIPLLLAGLGFLAVFVFFKSARPATEPATQRPALATKAQPQNTNTAPNADPPRGASDAATGIEASGAAPGDATAPATAAPVAPAVPPALGTVTPAGESATLALAAQAEPVRVMLDQLPIRKKINKLIRRAERQISKAEYDGAERTLQRARRLDPRYAPVFKALGIARARNGDADGARWAYNRYLKLAPRAKDAADVRRILGQ